MKKKFAVFLVIGLILAAGTMTYGSAKASSEYEWKTYKNAQYGFQFKYPSFYDGTEVELSEFPKKKNQHFMVIAKPDYGDDVTNEEFGLEVLEIKIGEAIQKLKDKYINKKVRIAVKDITLLNWNAKETSIIGEYETYIGDYYFTSPNNPNYTIVIRRFAQNGYSNPNFQKILETLKF